MSRGRRTLTVASGMCLAGAIWGCSLPEQRADFSSSDPKERMLAAADVAQRNDLSAAPRLIEMLDSPDPGERMLAITTLERLTDQTLGYEYAAPERERSAAVARWVEWSKSGAALAERDTTLSP